MSTPNSTDKLLISRGGVSYSITYSDINADATQALTDAASAQSTADAALPKAGGTMTGTLTSTAGATFAGDVFSDSGTDKSSLKQGAILLEPGTQNYGGVIQVQPQNGSDITAEINANGSATFTGTTTLNVPGNSDALSVRQSGVGAEYLTIYAADGGGGQLFVKDGSGITNIQLLGSDGSAEFAGSVQAGNLNTGLTNVEGSLISANGSVFAQRPGSEANSTILFAGYRGTSLRFSVNADGDGFFTGNVTAGNVSDIKFKENITDASPQLDDVVALGSSLKNWTWKEEAPLNEELRSNRFLGLIAQEAEQICPSLTYEVGEGEDSFKAINHDILVMKLLGAVAEQNAQIEDLKTEITALQASITPEVISE